MNVQAQQLKSSRNLISETDLFSLGLPPMPREGGEKGGFRYRGSLTREQNEVLDKALAKCVAGFMERIEARSKWSGVVGTINLEELGLPPFPESYPALTFDEQRRKRDEWAQSLSPLQALLHQTAVALTLGWNDMDSPPESQKRRDRELAENPEYLVHLGMWI
jgi:hypothetical protein